MGDRPDLIEVVERVLEILARGSFTTTYKHAVLLGLIELCASGQVAGSVTTPQLARAVTEIYWPMARNWPDRGVPLRQGSQGAAERGGSRIIGLVLDYQRKTGHSSFARADAENGRAFASLLREVEWTLVEMPLPKLQRVQGQDRKWLYEIGWTDSRLPSKRDLGTGRFDNRLLLLPGVDETLRRLAGVLRPLIQEEWVRQVARFDKNGAPDVHEFLFGSSRATLEPVREPLIQLQRGACFYCDGRLRRGSVEIDHFVPWARYPCNDLANLVAAHPACNGAKSDHLAATRHVEKWGERLEQNEVLAELASDSSWMFDDGRALGVARVQYEQFPADAGLWLRGREFEVSPRADVLRLLGG